MKNVRFYARVSFDTLPARYYDLILVLDYRPGHGDGIPACARRPVDMMGRGGAPFFGRICALDLDEQGGTGGDYLHVSEKVARTVDLELIQWYKRESMKKSCPQCGGRGRIYTSSGSPMRPDTRPCPSCSDGK